MPISLRIPPEKEELIKQVAKKSGKTRIGFILNAVDKKLGLTKNREQIIRKTAGWLTPEETSELIANLKVFEEIHETY
jgi:uncharacterized protein (DUF1778 family)